MRWFLIYYDNESLVCHRDIIWNISAIIYYYFSYIKIEIMHIENLTVIRRQNSRTLSSVKKFREVLGEELAVMIVLFIHQFIFKKMFNDYSMPGIVLGTGSTQLDNTENSLLKRNLHSVGKRLTINGRVSGHVTFLKKMKTW